MKKLTIVAFIVASLVTTPSFRVFSQRLAGSPGLRSDVSENPSGNFALSLDRILLRNEVPGKAIHNLLRTYKNPDDVKWFRTTTDSFGISGFRAVFGDSVVRNMVIFDNKGDLYSTMRYYGEVQLPREIRHHIKSEYYDFSISHVTEIIINDVKTYGVNLENPETLKVVLVSDSGTMIEIQSFKNADSTK